VVTVEQNDAVAEIGRNVTGVQGDVGNLDDLDRRVEAVTAHTGRVGVLFASAGNHTFDEPLGAVTERYFDDVFDVNVQGHLLHRAEAAAADARRRFDHPQRLGRGGPGSPGSTVYAPSTAALRSCARTRTTDLKERRIRSISVVAGNSLIRQPGLFATYSCKEYPTF
jgi:NAD(P)-dependent dehydrogenase (short-subunit alcohol dehydrogenase family)